MPKKSVLFIIDNLFGGGAERVLVDILKAFDYDRYQVTLLVGIPNGVYINDLPQNVSKVVLFETYWQLQAKRLLFRLYQRFGIDAPLKRYIRHKMHTNFDTIISFCEGPSMLYHRFLLPFSQNNITWVHTDLVHNAWSKAYFYQQDEQKTYLAMQKIICVSNAVKKHFLQLNSGISPEKIEVIHNLIPITTIQSKAQQYPPIRQKPFTIVCVGRLVKEKGFEKIILAASQLHNEGFPVQVWILGEGPLQKPLEELINKLQLGVYIQLFGFVKEPYYYMAQADLLVNTSSVEGFPVSICEAMCLGKPIVAFHTDGTAELLENTTYGMTIEPTLQALVQAIKDLITHPELLAHYASQSTQRTAIFAPETILPRIYDLI